jgi:transcriptional regulatory protein LevR
MHLLHRPTQWHLQQRRQRKETKYLLQLSTEEKDYISNIITMANEPLQKF